MCIKSSQKGFLRTKIVKTTYFHQFFLLNKKNDISNLNMKFDGYIMYNIYKMVDLNFKGFHQPNLLGGTLITTHTHAAPSDFDSFLEKSSAKRVEIIT